MFLEKNGKKCANSRKSCKQQKSCQKFEIKNLKEKIVIFIE
jgi:hypothetical protein